MIYRDFSMDPDDHILRRIEALGVAPEDVGTIVLSHLHSDHSGYIELFPNATVYVHADELGQRLAEYERGETTVGVRDMAYWARHNIIWERIAADEPEREIFPRITILNFGAGHSHGMLGLLVDLPGAGKILCAGDAVYNRENVGPPIRLAGNMVDADGFVRAIERISALAGELGAQLWYGHDEEQFASLIKSTEGYYS
jgi:glyoxylase-like metal-dependent hydrolase (beta-lactamase superfamily II)